MDQTTSPSEADDIELETFDEMVNDLWAGTPAQQLAARDLVEQLAIEELTDLLMETEKGGTQ